MLGLTDDVESAGKRAICTGGTGGGPLEVGAVTVLPVDWPAELAGEADLRDDVVQAARDVAAAATDARTPNCRRVTATAPYLPVVQLP
jgi:hypothetical protein